MNSTNPSVPLIYTRDTLPPGMSVVMRVWCALLSVCALGMLGVGAYLTPTGRGYSTHTQLGLQPCEFERRTGVPCISCGYTTAVTYFAHGNLVASFYLQPMGFLIGLCACVTAWVGFYIAFTGRPVYRLLGQIPVRGWLWFVLTFAVGGWAWKIFIHLTGHDHWP